VQHDYPGAASEPPCQWREQITWRCQSDTLERRLDRRAGPRGADHKYYKRRAHQDLDGAGIFRAVSQTSWRLGRPSYRARFLAAGYRYSRCSALGYSPKTKTPPDRICAATCSHTSRTRWRIAESIRKVNRILDPEILTIGFA